ncbi:MAG: peptidase M24 [Planctomycetota bacterium]|nr:MAG: peptidase M24 [Planctomycetota bacterium]
MDYQRYSSIYIDAGLKEKSKKRYLARRNKLAKNIGHLCVINGLEIGPGNKEIWAYVDSRIYQEPLLLYLTGINQLNVSILLDPTSKTSKEILFIAPKNPTFEFWEGLRFGVGESKNIKEIQQITGIKDIREYSTLEKTLNELLKKQKDQKKIGILWHQKTQKPKNIIEDNNFLFLKKMRSLFKKNKWSAKNIINIAPEQWDLRLPLDAVDIKNTRTANLKTINSFKALLSNVHLMKSECEIRGYLDGHMQMQSPYGLSFPTIAASGKNATILHYVKNDEPTNKKDLLLLDFGTKWMSMHSDISRTFPLDGKFNPMQALLYQIVLDCNLYVEKNAKAGLKLLDLNKLCWEFIQGELKKRFLDKGGKMKLSYKTAPHGVSHLMGEQEHDGDPFGEYKSTPMKESWLISNEPGLYGQFKINIKGKSYDQAIGIRVEDNLLIQKNGCINLSAGCPKTIKEIESIMKTGKAKNKKITF